MNRTRFPLLAFLAATLLIVAACTGAAPAGPTAGPFRPGGDGGEPGDDSGEPEAPVLPDQQLIVYTGSLQLDVADLPAAVQQADELVRGLGGHVAASYAENAADYHYATVTYRIPAPRWQDALNGLKALAERVVLETTESEDVTAQVVDLDARLANLRATESALQAIMDRATTIDDVLEVQRELTNVRGDIESLTAQREFLANRAALATLEVTFGVPKAAVSLASGGWDLGREIDSALAALVRLGQLAASLAIWLVLVIVPLFVPIALAIYVAVRLRRWWLANHPPTQPWRVPPPGAPSP